MSVHVLSYVLRESEAKLADRLVLLVLADRANDDGTGAWPSVATIATEARVSRSTVQRSLRKLAATGEIEEAGTSKYGTTIWTLVGYRRGRHIDTPPAAIANGEGAAITTSGGPQDEARTVLEQPSELQPSELPRARGPVGPSWKVDRRPVTFEEEALAGEVLGYWNRATGQNLRSKDWLAKIVLRIREHPEGTLADHQRVIDATLAAPWWKGPPSPSVVYGNGAQFERSIEQARGTRSVAEILAERRAS